MPLRHKVRWISLFSVSVAAAVCVYLIVDGNARTSSPVMYITETTLTPAGAAVIVTNGTRDRIHLDRFYALQSKKDGAWSDMDALEEPVFLTDGFALGAGGSMEFELDWASYYGTLAPGEYRIIKEYAVDRDSGGARLLTAEFTVPPQA